MKYSIVTELSTFLLSFDTPLPAPGSNSAEAAQLTREAHGGQHEAANGRVKTRE